MTVSLVLVVLLAAALAVAVTALLRGRRAAAAEERPGSPPPEVVGREAQRAVDLGLRALAQECTRTARALPDLYAVSCSAERLTLRLATADDAAPPPWAANDAADQWSVDRSALRPDGVVEARRPYPLVVTVGFGAGQRVLLDLARATTPVAVTGDAREVQRLLGALVAELVTGPVGREAEVTLVGAVAAEDIAEASGVRSPRLHTAATLGEARARAAGAAGAAGATGAVDTSRWAAQGATPPTQVFQFIGGRPVAVGATWRTPRLFVVEAQQYHEESAALDSGQALLVVGDVPEAAWRLRAHADGRLDTGALGLRVDVHAGRSGGEQPLR